MKKLLTSCAVLSLASMAIGQTAVSAPDITSVTYLGTYSVASQAFLPTPPPGVKVIVYDNSTSNGSLFPAGAGLANMDWGTLSAAGNNDITTFQIGYGTATPDPFQVGVVDLTISLHEGADGFGNDGTTITSFNVSGLPGSASGAFEGFVVDVALPGPVNLPDGPIGYSYEAADNNTGPLTIGPPNEAGVIDAFDQYDGTGGPIIGTFNFGGAPFGSFHCQLQGTTPECFLVIGDGHDGATFTPETIPHTFNTSVGNVQASFPTLLDSLPVFKMPEGTSLFGQGLGRGTTGTTESPDWMDDGQFSVQVVMWNPGVFPQLPEQFTSSLKVKIMPNGTLKTRPVGDSVGMEVWAETFEVDGETYIRFPFSIDGL